MLQRYSFTDQFVLSGSLSPGICKKVPVIANLSTNSAKQFRFSEIQHSDGLIKNSKDPRHKYKSSE